MPQLHFSVDDRTAQKIQREAGKRGLTVSKYLAALVSTELATEWPAGYLDDVIGACAKHPIAEPDDPPADEDDIRGL